MAEMSPGKDTTTGHWELAGIILEKPFTTFPPDFPSFPKKLVDLFEQETGRKILGNKAASGTEIIEELGDRHVETGNPICYTSADSVFQIAAHEDVIPPDELYRICETARRLCDPLQVARVIARPFVGKSGAYTRTLNRRDFSIALPAASVLDVLREKKVHTVAVGKIGSIFNESGIAESLHDAGNPACIRRTMELLTRPRRKDEFIFVNLVDTDMIYGHRRDVEGYHDALSEVDGGIEEILPLIEDEDLLIITADHGCDPTHPGTDHTREYVPLLVYRPGLEGQNLGIRETFSDTAESVLSFFGLPSAFPGRSFLS
jgi:phosphopentomutase